MTGPEITIKPDRQTKPDGPTLEERIITARDKFLSETSGDVERAVIGALEVNYDATIHRLVGLRKDHWDSGYHLEHGSGKFASQVHDMAKDAAQRLLDQIDFSKVELTQGQVNAIKTAYSNALKKEVEYAAQALAREDAMKVAAKVLGIEIEEAS